MQPMWRPPWFFWYLRRQSLLRRRLFMLTVACCHRFPGLIPSSAEGFDMTIISSPRTIGVCGIGQIGLALGLACWRSGYRVCVYGRNPQKLDRERQDLTKMDQ